jgi:hypothetical protein
MGGAPLVPAGRLLASERVGFPAASRRTHDLGAIRVRLFSALAALVVTGAIIIVVNSGVTKWARAWCALTEAHDVGCHYSIAKITKVDPSKLDAAPEIARHGADGGKRPPPNEPAPTSPGLAPRALNQAPTSEVHTTLEPLSPADASRNILTASMSIKCAVWGKHYLGLAQERFSDLTVGAAITLTSTMPIAVNAVSTSPQAVDEFAALAQVRGLSDDDNRQITEVVHNSLVWAAGGLTTEAMKSADGPVDAMVAAMIEGNAKDAEKDAGNVDAQARAMWDRYGCDYLVMISAGTSRDARGSTVSAAPGAGLADGADGQHQALSAKDGNDQERAPAGGGKGGPQSICSEGTTVEGVAAWGKLGVHPPLYCEVAGIMGLNPDAYLPIPRAYPQDDPDFATYCGLPASTAAKGCYFHDDKGEPVILLRKSGITSANQFVSALASQYARHLGYAAGHGERERESEAQRVEAVIAARHPSTDGGPSDRRDK